MTLPQDPFILLSYINTQLRDNYSSLDELCSDMNIEKNNLEAKLDSIGYAYVKELNQFR
jgi:hypothetical protein